MASRPTHPLKATCAELTPISHRGCGCSCRCSCSCRYSCSCSCLFSPVHPERTGAPSFALLRTAGMYTLSPASSNPCPCPCPYSCRCRCRCRCPKGRRPDTKRPRGLKPDTNAAPLTQPCHIPFKTNNLNQQKLFSSIFQPNSHVKPPIVKIFSNEHITNEMFYLEIWQMSFTHSTTIETESKSPRPPPRASNVNTGQRGNNT
jgi:hypothetical protein